VAVSILLQQRGNNRVAPTELEQQVRWLQLYKQPLRRQLQLGVGV
jgi:hypothetical protein